MERLAAATAASHPPQKPPTSLAKTNPEVETATSWGSRISTFLGPRFEPAESAADQAGEDQAEEPQDCDHARQYDCHAVEGYC